LEKRAVKDNWALKKLKKRQMGSGHLGTESKF
jgi:hypothetical protein